MDKKPFWKKWWIWVIVILVVAGIFGVQGDSDKETSGNDPVIVDSGDENNTSDDESENTESVTEEEVESEDNVEPRVRDNTSAEQTSLGAGEFEVGTDINQGRYVITASEGSGNLFVYEGSMPVVNEILGADFGVKSVTADLEEGDVIQIMGLPNVDFTPAETSLRTTLTTGEWIVGLDIEEGRYIAEVVGEKTGNFFVYRNSLPVVNEILDGGQTGFGVPNVTTTLKEGDEIRIMGIDEIKFTIK